MPGFAWRGVTSIICFNFLFCITVFGLEKFEFLLEDFHAFRLLAKLVKSGHKFLIEVAVFDKIFVLEHLLWLLPMLINS